MEAKIHRRPHHPRVLTEEAFSWSETAAPMSSIAIIDTGIISERSFDRTDNSCQHDSSIQLCARSAKDDDDLRSNDSFRCNELHTPEATPRYDHEPSLGLKIASGMEHCR